MFSLPAAQILREGSEAARAAARVTSRHGLQGPCALMKIQQPPCHPACCRRALADPATEETSDHHGSRSRRFSYLIACENARRVMDDPGVLAGAKAHLDRFSKGDPHQGDGYALWSGLLAQGPGPVAAALRDMTPQGAYARATAPSFWGLPPAVRTRLLKEARMRDAAAGGTAG